MNEHLIKIETKFDFKDKKAPAEFCLICNLDRSATVKIPFLQKL